MGALEGLVSGRMADQLQEIRITEEIERNPWENLMVSMERSFYNIVDLAGTSVRKLSTFALEEEDPRKDIGAGWIGRNAGRVSLWAGEEKMDPGLAPETDPELMDKFAELLGTTIPYTVAAIGGAAIGAAGGAAAGLGVAGVKLTAAAAAGLTSFSIMREEGYRGAIETGATESQANIEGNIVGGINALLELANLGTILRGSRTGGVILKSIALNARNKAWGQVLKEGGKFTMTMVRSATEEAIQEALQGTTSELVPKMLRGVEVEPGFWGRRGTEAVGGAVIGTLFSGLGSMGEAAISKGQARAPQIQEVEDIEPTTTSVPAESKGAVLDWEEARNTLTEKLGRDPTTVEVQQEMMQESFGRFQKMDMINEGQEIDPSNRIDVDITTPVEKFGKLIGELDTKEIRQLTKEEVTKEKGKRVAVAAKIKEETFEKTGDIDKANQVARRVLKGEYPKTTFEGFTEEQFSPSDWKDLRLAIYKSDLMFFQQMHATDAIIKLQQGLIPTVSEMEVLSKVTGELEALTGFAVLGQEQPSLAYRIMTNILNTPTTLLTTFDMSMMGRQGLVAAFRFPKQWGKAFVAQHRAFWGPKYTQAALNDMRTSHYADTRSMAGLRENTIDGGIATTEQHFYAQWLKKIPVFGRVVAASERAAVVGLNKLRVSIFDKTAEQWEGTNKTTSDYKKLADIVNHSTGIGTGKFIDKYGPLLNAGFFSPRYLLSRFQLIGDGTKAFADIATGKPGAISKIVASELVSFVAAGFLVMALAEAAGADIEKDPRSSDFGKIKVGRTRIDVWAGNQQLARAASQLIFGQGKSLRSEEIYTKNRLEVFGQFIQSKLSPVAGLGVEILSGKTFLGEPLPDKVDTPMGAFEYAIQKLAPLAIQDTIDAWRFQGGDAAMAAGPLAWYGIGVQTYEPSPLDNLTEMRDHYALQVFGTDWEELGPSFQEALEEYKPQIVEQERVSKFERRNAEFNAARQREAGRAVEKALPKEVLRELKNLDISVGGLSRTLTKGWRLNGKLYKRYQTDLAALLSKVMPKITGMAGYENLPHEVKVEMVEMILRETKSAVRNNIIVEANMKDIERTF